MHSSREYRRAIYHLVKSAMIDRTIGYDSCITVILSMIYRFDRNFNCIMHLILEIEVYIKLFIYVLIKY